MSFDLAVWASEPRLSAAEAGERYARLCEGDVVGLVPSPAVDAFYRELIAKHPELDDVPEDRLDDHDYCPWSVRMDRSPGHLVLCCVWSRAEYVRQFVGELARKHGLAVFDPQEGTITFPDPVRPKKPW
jgi:hypothetical protein